ncbi:MAG: recombination protein O N-terminal domain-containing protein [Verrucomicrobiota bacterium]
MERTSGTIIRLTRFSDSSVIVHWLTGSHGLVKTVVKGAFRAKSPFHGKLDLFFECEFLFQRTRTGDLHYLREIVPRETRLALRSNYGTTLLASYFCRLLEMTVEPEHPDMALHDLLARALAFLEKEPPRRRALLHFENELARLLGIASAPGGSGASGEVALRGLIGKLPAAREELLERFSKVEEFRSSDSEIGE